MIVGELPSSVLENFALTQTIATWIRDSTSCSPDHSCNVIFVYELRLTCVERKAPAPSTNSR
jgi:hypothetical protein